MLLSGVLFVLFLDGCWLYCLADAALTPASAFRGLSKVTWLCIIVATFIVGAIAWLIARRSWRAKSWAASQVNRTTSPTPGDTSAIGYANWTAIDETAATDAAVARHPAGRSKKAAQDSRVPPKGPDDDPEFLRQLDHRIHGTSADSSE